MGWLDSIICTIRWAVAQIGNVMLEVVEFILTALIVAVNAVVSLLPNDPTGEASAPSGAIAIFNYFIPMGAIVGQFSLVMTAWILYRLYQWLLRWAKAEG